jgi:ribosomal protein S18 acetylase RimI-like enzyme
MARTRLVTDLPTGMRGGLVVDFASVTDAQRGRAVGTLVLAFAADPFVRWIYPEPTQYLLHFPSALEAFGGSAFAADTVWRLGDFAAVALWMPPGVEPDGEATLAHLQATVTPDKTDDLMAVFAQMDEAHPTIRHWYLPWFGVDSVVQGQGLGSELMRTCLEIVDRDHLPAYLDSTNPRNVSFYQRHGFTVTGEWRAGTSPPIISMLRDPR